MKRTFHRMCLVGCGLIGGSVSLAFKRTGAVKHVVGVDVSERILAAAIARGAIDEGMTDLAAALSGADLVIIAAPVALTGQLLHDVAQHELRLAESAIVTDVSGAKAGFVKQAARLFMNASFVGGHPMAGSEKSGIASADALLLENAVYVLTPTAQTDHTAVAALQELLTVAGARVRIMAPEQHDRVVAAISHVPHLIAAALVNQVADLAEEDSAYTELAAGGFRDITRIASSDPALWSDLSLENSADILTLITDWQERLQWLKTSIAEKKAQELEQFFSSARTFRDLLPAKSTGALRSSYSMTVFVSDEPGVIGHIAALLGEKGISIRNIGILESREGDDGQLLLQFDTIEFHDRAAVELASHGFSIQDRT